MILGPGRDRSILRHDVAELSLLPQEVPRQGVLNITLLHLAIVLAMTLLPEGVLGMIVPVAERGVLLPGEPESVMIVPVEDVRSQDHLYETLEVSLLVEEEIYHTRQGGLHLEGHVAEMIQNHKTAEAEVQVLIVNERITTSQYVFLNKLDFLYFDAPCHEVNATNEIVFTTFNDIPAHP
jgi:hypothetical protein